MTSVGKMPKRAMRVERKQPFSIVLGAAQFLPHPGVKNMNTGFLVQGERIAMIQLGTSCACCGAKSNQRLQPALPYFGPQGEARLDGIVFDHGLRGMMLCTECGAAAPDLAEPAPGLSRKAVAAAFKSPTWRRGLHGQMPALASSGPVDDNAISSASPDAARWFAYVTTFGDALPASRSGCAWAAAAAELDELAAGQANGAAARFVPRDLASFCRRQAVRQLQHVAAADFPSTRVLPRSLVRWIARRRLGETGRDAIRAELVTDGLCWRRDLGRFDRACLLVDLLRRLGQFDDAIAIATHVLATGGVPMTHKSLLQTGIGLCRARCALRRVANDGDAAHVARPAA